MDIICPGFGFNSFVDQVREELDRAVQSRQELEDKVRNLASSRGVKCNLAWP